MKSRYLFLLQLIFMIVTQPLFINAPHLYFHDWPARLNLIPFLDSPYLETRRIVGRGFIRNDPWDVWVKQWWGRGWGFGFGGDWSIGGCWGHWLTEYDRRSINGDIDTFLSPVPLLLRAPIGADFFRRQTPPQCRFKHTVKLVKSAATFA